MNDIKNTKHKKDSDDFARKVEMKVRRKIKREKKSNRTLWLGFSLMGLVGWGVSIPTLLGVMLGIFLDKHFPSKHSWTLMCLIIGLIVGCFVAWFWVSREERELRKREEDLHE